MADKDLFLKNYSFYGKHCDMVKRLTQKIDEDSGASVFNAAIELFVVAALVGVKNDHKEKPSVDKTRETKILAEQFNSHSPEVQIAFKMVTLLGNANKYDEIERLNRTFRNPETNDNYSQFEEYMLGGLEDIYNKIMLDTNKVYSDYLKSINEFLDQFKAAENDDDSIVPDSDNLFD